MMTEDPLPVATTLGVAGEIVAAKLAEPTAPDERAEVLAAIHRLDATTTPEHDRLAECLGLIGADGRCEDCGRLVVVGAWKHRAHQDGGCLMAIPFVGSAVWVWHHKGSVPLFGQWLYRRQRKARSDPTSNGQAP
jgi:hypothetical protein